MTNSVPSDRLPNTSGPLASQSGGGQIPNVLFVEDCDSDYELACLGLERTKATAQRVSTGRDLQTYMSATSERIDLYIVDLSLPDSSGLDLTEKLRGSQVAALTPIVIFSSSTNPRDAEAARQRGANDYHVKPVAPDDFLRVVEQIVSRWLPQTK